MGKKVILGSASPRRKELLEQIGAGFEIKVSDKEEIYHSERPEDIVCELALMKAENVASELSAEERRNAVVIGADHHRGAGWGDPGQTGRPGGCRPDALVPSGQMP